MVAYRSLGIFFPFLIKKRGLVVTQTQWSRSKKQGVANRTHLDSPLSNRVGPTFQVGVQRL